MLHGIHGHGKPILKSFLAKQDDVTVLDVRVTFSLIRIRHDEKCDGPWIKFPLRGYSEYNTAFSTRYFCLPLHLLRHWKAPTGYCFWPLKLVGGNHF